MKSVHASTPTEIEDDVRVGPAADTEENEFHILALLNVLAKRKWMVVRVVALVGVVALIVALFIPNSYTAVTKLMPPQQSQSLASNMILGQLGSLGGMASGLGLRSGDLYLDMLKSRTVLDSLIDRFDLQKVYRAKTRTEARTRLDAASSVSSARDGVIVIAVEDRDRKRCADLANAFADELKKLTQSLAVTEASQRRVFFERELQSTNADLARAEDELKQTQQGTGLVHPESQAKALIEADTNIQAKINAKEVELRSMSAFATTQNPARMRAEEELAAMRDQLARLEGDQKRSAFQVPVGQLPEAGVEYARKARQVKYYEVVLELLAKQYEIARIDEARDPVLVQVLDKAVEPEIKTKPKRAMIVFMAMAMAMIASLILALVLEAGERLTFENKLGPGAISTLLRWCGRL